MSARLVFAVVMLCYVFVDSSRLLKGIDPAKAVLYASKTFACFDGSNSIPISAVNDDYCDCKDGSDEPGTSACNNAFFFCENKGHHKDSIPSYRVNDGVCDCCDAADEYLTNKCQNTCEEAGRAKREAQALQRIVAEEGYKLKLKYVEECRAKKSNRIAEKNVLLQEEKIKNSELETIKAEVAELEIPEQSLKGAFDQQWDETVKKLDLEATELQFLTIDANFDGSLTFEEFLAVPHFDKDGDGVVSIEEAKQAFNRTDDASRISLEEFRASDMLKDYADKFPKAEVPEKPAYDLATQQAIDAATQARSLKEQKDEEIEGIKDSLEKLNKDLGTDIGPEEQFCALQGQCFEISEKEYVYSVCPFDSAKQTNTGSGGSTSLGKWGKWIGSPDNKYSKMIYENGEKCWNGPARSMTVTIECGSSNRVTAVSEPNRCEYAMTLVSPAACGPPGKHDEF